MGKRRPVFVCGACGHQSAQWAGRCPSCNGWGTVEAVPGFVGATGTTARASTPLPLLGAAEEVDRRVPTGSEGIDRVLGGGLVPSSVTLLAGEPGIGKSTLLLHLVAHLSASGLPCLVASGEESHAQVGARARRLGLSSDELTFAPGRDLEQLIATAREARPFLLAVDSIQTLRDTSGTQVPGGVAQVRICADALVGFAKAEGVAVLLTGHVTKDGDLAGPRALEHAVDVVLAFDGDPRSGLRVLSAGKNRFGAEGETAWFEMGESGLLEIDPRELLLTGEQAPGAAVALPRAGRRALALEVQALVGPCDGPPRRHATGLDPRRFQLVAAVLDRVAGVPVGRAELFGAVSGGIRVDDPACDLAVAAALTSAATGVPAPSGSAFVGEISLTGLVRPAPGMTQRLAAARSAGCTVVFAPKGASASGIDGVRLVHVRDVRDALGWTLPAVETGLGRRSA